MKKTGKPALWALLLAGIAGCSDSNDRPAPQAEESSHYVVLTGIDAVNVDNGQPVAVTGDAVFGGAQIGE